jgi:outer membrane immunogenic protein
MRFRTFTTATLLASIAGFAPAAFAADFSFGPLRGTQYGAPMGQTHIWDGGYFGAFASVTNGSARVGNGLRNQISHEQRLSTFENNVQTANWLSLPTANGRKNTFGFFAGLNYQYDEAVLGFEVDFTRAHLSMTSADSLTRVVALDGLFLNGVDLAGQTGAVTITGSSSVRLKNMATLRARAGYTMGSFLPFVTAGAALTDYTVTHTAYRSVNASAPERIAHYSKSRIGLGLAAGLGVDVAVAENAFLRAEWQYAVFPSLDGVRVNVNNLRAAAGVKF